MTPIGVHDAVLTHTAKANRRPGEVSYDSRPTNYSVLKPRSSAMVPCPYGGNFLFEVVDSAAAAISTESYAKFIDKYLLAELPDERLLDGLYVRVVELYRIPSGTRNVFLYVQQCDFGVHSYRSARR